MKIISKYVLKEHVGPLVFSFTALTSLLLLNYIARQLGQLVGKGLGWEVIMEFLLLSIPFTFAMTIPMAILVSVLYAFSRLAAENEVTAFKASGVSMWRLLNPVLLLGAAATVGMILFNDQVLPRANHRLAALQQDIMRTKPTFALKEQVINELQAQRLYLRASRVFEGTSRLADVTVYDLTDPTRRRTIYADSGTIRFAPNNVDLYMTLYDGVMQEVPTGDPSQLTRLFYRIDRIRVPDVGSQFSQTGGTREKSDREMTVCEMSVYVSTAERRMLMAYNEYLKASVDFARAEGKKVADAKPVDLTPTPSFGRVYCGVVKHLFGGPKAVFAALAPATLHAQQPPAQQPPGQQPLVQQPPVQQRPPEPPAPTRGTPPGVVDTVVRHGLPGEVQNTTPAVVPQPAPPPTVDAAPPVTYSTPQPSSALAESDARKRDALMQIESNRKEANKYLVEIHKKFALAVACFVFVLVGAPLALRFPRGGVGLTLGVSFAIFGLYYVGLISGETLADRDYMPAGLAMWLTNILMLILGTFLALRMGKEFGTQRGGGGGLGEAFARLRYRRTLARRAR